MEELYWRNEFGKPIVGLHNTKRPNSKACLAIELMKHLAIILAEPDGEDSAGRQKLKMMPAETVAARACNIAEAAFRNFEARGWCLDAPSYDELLQWALKDKSMSGGVCPAEGLPGQKAAGSGQQPSLSAGKPDTGHPELSTFPAEDGGSGGPEPA